MKNNTFDEIISVIEKSRKIAIFPHILMDGDAMGSAVALCHAFRNAGKDAAVIVEDKIPDYLAFLGEDYCTYDQDAYMESDIALCIDCGELKRFPKRADTFMSGKIKICIDHHPTSPGIGDFNYIDGGAAAAGELVYELLKTWGIPFDSTISNAIFAAITTDTGNFQYSNTSKKSHEIVMDLYDNGLDAYATSVALYENESFAKISLMSRVLSEADVFAGGKAIIGSVSRELLGETGARMEDTEGIVGTMRSIKGIDIAVLLKEKDEDHIKVSLRAKEGNVAVIAESMGGGGHERAAGCTVHSDMESVREDIIKAVEESLCRE